MKKTGYVIVVLFIFQLPIVAQKIEINFMPSFFNHSRFIITNKDTLCKVQLDIFEGREKIIHSETIYVSLSFLDSFNSFFSVETDTITNDILGLDGTSIKGKYENERVVKYFDFWSPKRNSKEYILFRESIDYIRREMNSKESKKYLGKLNALLREKSKVGKIIYPFFPFF